MKYPNPYMENNHPIVVPPPMNPARIPRSGTDQTTRNHIEGGFVTPIFPMINIRATHTTDHARIARLYPTA